MTNAVLEAMELIGQFTADSEKFPELAKREVFLYPDDNNNWNIPAGRVLKVSLEFVTPEEVRRL